MEEPDDLVQNGSLQTGYILDEGAGTDGGHSGDEFIHFGVEGLEEYRAVALVERVTCCADCKGGEQGARGVGLGERFVNEYVRTLGGKGKGRGPEEVADLGEGMRKCRSCLLFCIFRKWDRTGGISGVSGSNCCSIVCEAT